MRWGRFVWLARDAPGHTAHIADFTRALEALTRPTAHGACRQQSALTHRQVTHSQLRAEALPHRTLPCPGHATRQPLPTWSSGGHAVATQTVSPQQRTDASVGLKVTRLRCLLEELRRDVLKRRGDAIRVDS